MNVQNRRETHTLINMRHGVFGLSQKVSGAMKGGESPQALTPGVSIPDWTTKGHRQQDVIFFFSTKICETKVMSPSMISGF